MLKKIVLIFFYYPMLPVIILYSMLIIKKKEKVLWGPVPMINYKYWSIALSKHGYDTETLVSNYYHIHQKDDFSLYYEDVVPKLFSKSRNISMLLGPMFSFFYAIRFAKIINISNRGSFLGGTPIWYIEAYLFKLFSIKTVLSGFGSDYYMYSKIDNASLKHVLLMSYPKNAINENSIGKKVNYWTRHADIILGSYSVDGIGRWDCLPVNMVTISDDKIALKEKKVGAVNNEITIVHSPNHRGFKGTEFIVKAIDELITDGYEINFILLENIENIEVLRILREEADILIEQIIVGYGLSGIEGMANGVAVLSNINGSNYRTLRRYSYLNECPILSTSPETVKENIKLLIENRELREELGRLGIDYVRKYHSEKSAQYMYGKIYSQLLNGTDEDLINMFHPLKSEYVKSNYIKTPLLNNCYIDKKEATLVTYT